jgi:hypothetical protein
MGNKLNLCNGVGAEPYEQTIVLEPDAIVKPIKGTNGNFSYYDSNDKVYVSLLIIIIVRI